MKKISLLIIFFCGMNCFVKAQVDQKVDSLLKQCRRLSNQPDSLFIVGEFLLKTARTEQHLKAYIEGYFAKGYSKFQIADYPPALIYFDSAISVQKTDEKRFYNSLARTLRNKGITYNILGDFQKSRQTFDELISLGKKFNNIRTIAGAYSQMGITAKNQSKYEEAISLYNQSLQLYDSMNDEKQKFFIFINLGIVYNITSQTVKSKEAVRVALRIAERNKMTAQIYMAYNNLSAIYRVEQKYDSSLWCINKILPYYERRNLVREYTTALQNKAHNFMFLEKYDSAEILFKKVIIGYDSTKIIERKIETIKLIGELNYRKQLYDSSIFYYEKALKIAKSKNLSFEYHSIFSNLAKSYEAKGDFKNANVFLKYLDRVKDSTYSIETQQALDEILTKYQVAEKNQKISELNEKKGFYQKLLWPVFAGIFIIGILAFFLYRRLKNSRENILLKEDELDSLRTELIKIKEESNQSQNSDQDLVHLKSKAILSANQIIYIKSDTHYLEFYLEGREKPEIDRSTFKEIEQVLPDGKFVRVHRSYLVNINYIKIINSTQIMLETGQWINLSRTYKPVIKEMIKSGYKSQK